ncbi:MAG: protein involved in cellulose biosynthesis (CelD)-like protein [Verrucomicrobiaceae bacterium]|nr:protein involved in cellulose biosynthesis (CelD)-like protein [Verrucomicrobiaceae bacterium]
MTESISYIEGSGYEGSFSALDSIETLEREWRALEPLSDCSFFLSWSWIGAWLQIVSAHTSLSIYRCYFKGELIALAVVGNDTIKRRHFFKSTMVTLNESCKHHLNMFIEYNGLLTQRGHETAALNHFIFDLNNSLFDWNELRLTNVPKAAYDSVDQQRLALKKITDRSLGIWVTPLDSNTTVESILNKLSKSRRWQIRRSFKEYSNEGTLKIDCAADVDQACDYFMRMGQLHTERWNRVGRTGSFAHPKWVKFHLALIRNAFNRGEIQMLRICCGERAIGYIYNFVWRNTVLMLQSGFASEDRNMLRPGYVSHLLAIEYNAALGMAIYNFLAGDSQYKAILGTAQPPLLSGRLQRPHIKFSIENALVKTHQFISRIARTPNQLLRKNFSKLIFSGYWIAEITHQLKPFAPADFI